MKKNTVLIAAILTLVSAFALTAQVPRTFSYQGYLADGSGSAVSNGVHTISVSLYSAPTGGSPVYTETQSVGVSDGIFSMVIGATTPIPTSLAFNRQVYLGLSIDGGSELTPRTAITSVPSAMTAGEAESLSPGATGFVRSINGTEGDLTILGGGGTTVARTGSTITISSSGGSGGSGMQGVQSSDGTISVANPNGPVANLSLADGAVSSGKIKDGAVTAAKLSTAGSTSGQVLTSDGANVYWDAPATGGLTLPYEGTTSAAGMKVTANGSDYAFEALSNGSAGGALFSVRGSESTKNALSANTRSSAPAIYARNSNNGEAIKAVCDTCDYTLTSLNSTDGSAIYGNSRDGIGVHGVSPGEGIAVAGYSYGPDGIGVRATSRQGYGLYSLSDGSSAGRFVNRRDTNTHATVYITNNNARESLLAQTTGTSHAGAFEIDNTRNSKPALAGRSNGTGAGVLAENSSTVYGTALEVKNGFIKVTGTNKSAFVHTTTTANTATGSHITNLSYPGAHASDILLVTHQFGSYLPGGTSYSVWWNSDHWTIYLDDISKDMPVGTKFNVLVIKQ